MLVYILFFALIGGSWMTKVAKTIKDCREGPASADIKNLKQSIRAQCTTPLLSHFCFYILCIIMNQCLESCCTSCAVQLWWCHQPWPFQRNESLCIPPLHGQGSRIPRGHLCFGEAFGSYRVGGNHFAIPGPTTATETGSSDFGAFKHSLSYSACRRTLKYGVSLASWLHSCVA